MHNMSFKLINQLFFVGTCDTMKNNNQLSKLLNKYQKALIILETQIDLIIKEFESTKKYKPVEHTKSRLKTINSIKQKLSSFNKEYTLKNIEEYMYDIAGVRIVCVFKQDIYELIKLIKKSNIIKVIEEKNYIDNPKESGYRSYHLIVSIPINEGKNYVKAEIQLRTIAMDLWASLGHKVYYKKDSCPKEVSDMLFEFSNQINETDEKINQVIKDSLIIEEEV